MFFYVVECFSVNLKEVAADAVGYLQAGIVKEQVKRHSGLVAEAFSKPAHQVHQVGALNAKGTQVGDKAAQFFALVLDGLLERGQASGGLLGRLGQLPTEDVELDFQ